MGTRIISAKILKWVYINLIICLVLFSNPVVPSSNRVKTLPGFPGPLPFNLETGYIAVDEKEDDNFFYYFIESEGNPREDPLMLWFIGGPGCSALSAIAFEIGPLKFKIVQPNGSLPTLELGQYSWTKVANIIFIDAPVGSGFSYSRSSEPSKCGDRIFANQSFIFLKKWLLAHPKFISNPLYLGGDSYGGLIVPMLAEEVAKSIEAGQTPKFNLQGYLIGNGRTDVALDENARIPFAHRTALISDELYESAKRTCNGQFRANDSNNTQCANDLNAISKCTENINMYHILEPKCYSSFSANGKMKEGDRKSLLEMQSDQKQVQSNIRLGGPPPVVHDSNCLNLELIHIWANDKAVQKALHVREGTINIWIRCPGADLPYDREVQSVVSYHKRLISRGYRALVYSGDHDMVVSYIGTQTWVKSLNLPVIDPWRPWVVDNQIAGYVTEYAAGVTFATVKGSGHTAPEYRPKECFALFKRWMSQEPL